MMEGFYFRDVLLNRDVFVKTDRQRITDKFITDALNAAQHVAKKSYNVSANILAYYKKNVGFMRATLTEKRLSCGYFVDISGDGFSCGNSEAHTTLEDCYNIDKHDGVLVISV